MEAIIYERIKLLASGKVYPVYPTYDVVLPFVLYTRTTSEDNDDLSGPNELKRHEFSVDYWAVDSAACNTLGDEVKTLLAGWRALPQVQGCFMRSRSQEFTELGYHGMQSYTIWTVE